MIESNIITISNNNTNLEEKCRICLEKGKEELKNRCECNDLCHDSCLINWIKERPDTQDKKDMKCEICKTVYITDKKFNRKINNDITIIWCLITFIFFISLHIWFSFFLSNLKSEDVKFDALPYIIILLLIISIYLSILFYLSKL
jgi:hypothetical protein